MTTIAKAKEVRPIIERASPRKKDSRINVKLIHSIPLQKEIRGGRQWRSSSQWNEWNQAIAPVLTARRRAIQILGDKEAVSILFDTVAPRFEDRPGGYTRIMRLAQPRLGDGGTQVILEFVGVRDRIKEAAPEPIQVESDSTESTESARMFRGDRNPENETDDSNAAEGTEADSSKEVDSETE